jgi:hypothetical protein
MEQDLAERLSVISNAFRLALTTYFSRVPASRFALRKDVEHVVGHDELKIFQAGWQGYIDLPDVVGDLETFKFAISSECRACANGLRAHVLSHERPNDYVLWHTYKVEPKVVENENLVRVSVSVDYCWVPDSEEPLKVE